MTFNVTFEIGFTIDNVDNEDEAVEVASNKLVDQIASRQTDEAWPMLFDVHVERLEGGA